MSAPKGMWECPKCGDYLSSKENPYCPKCKVENPQRNKQRRNTSAKKTDNSRWNNPGASLKNLSKTFYKVFSILYIAVSIALIAYGLSEAFSWGGGAAFYLSGGVVLLCSRWVAWLTVLPLYAFGELVENVKYIADSVASLKSNDN